MANELQFTIQVNYRNGIDSDNTAEPFYMNVSATERIEGAPTIGTTEESLALGDVSSVGLVIIKNMDPTNYVTVGNVTGQRPIRIPPLTTFPLYLPGSAVFVAANTAPCKIVYKIFSV